MAVCPAVAETVFARPISIHRPGMTVMPWFWTLLNLDRTRHMRVQRAKILVIARCHEGEGEGAVGIHGFRPEFASGNHRVRNVVAVGPVDSRTDFHRELGGLEGE